ncbi:MAG: hypothetical protein IKB19_05150 [Rikenellaceae bacterium]|nr:hypothetical protein [Alistipes sp.]MBR2443668.1 hypothetical protein [Rikenellaceae bacterium]
MKRFFLTLSVAAALFTGCATTTVVQTTDYMESSARVLEPEQSMLLTPLIADLKVSDEKVYYTETEAFANLEVSPALLQNITELKKIALSRAARAHKADVLVGSTIDVITKDKRLEITISGYPAYYVKFRNVTKSDVDLLQESRKLHTKDGAEIVNAPKSRFENRNIVNR